MMASSELSRAYVNNGGDIALHLRANEKFCHRDGGAARSAFAFRHNDNHGFRSGARHCDQRWRRTKLLDGHCGRSNGIGRPRRRSRCGATIIANAVDLPGHPAIVRARAHELDPDSDLGDRLVTQAVDALTNEETHLALENGVRTAELLLKLGLIRSAALNCKARREWLALL